MTRTTWQWLAVAAGFVVAVHLLGIGAGQGADRADPSNAGGLSWIDGGLRLIPGLGHDLVAADLRGQACVDGARVLAGPAGCRVLVPEGIDRVRLRPVGQCLVVVAVPDQITQVLDSGDARDGELRIALTGDGAQLTASGDACQLTVVS